MLDDKLRKVELSDDSILEKMHELYRELDDQKRLVRRDYMNTQREIVDMPTMLALGKLQNERHKLINDITSKKLEVLKLTAARLTSKEANAPLELPQEAFDAAAMLDIVNEKKRERGRKARE